jgi:hypothetical protein
VVRFKPSLIDVPMVIFCLVPFISSQLNGLGAWDGVSAVISQVITWGMPYLIGRLYFTDSASLRDLAIAFFIGGLLYVPLCLFEMRMSPQLHNMVYGFFPRAVQTRYGGWRPAVFMDGGLQVGMWMTGASLSGFWLWKTGALKRLWGVSVEFLLVPLLITTVLCRAAGALSLLVIGLAAMWLCTETKSRWVLALLLMIAPVYLCLRSTAVWNGEPLTTMAGWAGPDRAGSLEFRFKNEDMLAAKAMQRPVFGWGGWGRSRIYDNWGKDISITDGLWIIEFGQHGIAGLAACFTSLLMPLALLIYRFPAKRLTSAEMAPALALSVLVCLYAIDCLPNAMTNPVYMLANGAVLSLLLGKNPLERSASPSARFDTETSIPRRRLHPGGN